MDSSRKKRIDILIASLVLAFAAALMLLAPSPLEMLENKLIDYRFKLRGSIIQPDKVVIAAIDEKSIERLGRWPWGRDKLASLLKSLTEDGSELVVFDVILSESEGNDPALGKAIKDAGNVILPVVFEFDRDVAPLDRFTRSRLNDSAFSAIESPDKFEKFNPILAGGALTPVPALINGAMGLGSINMFPDWDGTLRWEPMVIGYGNALYPSINLKAASAYLGIPGDKVVLRATEGIRLGKRFIPTDRFGRTLINYYGPEGTFRHIPISDIIDGRVDPSLLRGKIVLVGATAVGIYDLRVTPFSPGMPGVEKHASVISSILENRFLKPLPLYADLAVLLLSGLLFSVLILRFKALGASFVTALSILAIFYSGYYLFAHLGIVINITYPSLGVLAIFMTTTAYNYAVQERLAKKIRAMFSSYVTERVVNELIKNPDMAKMGGDRREITVLFSDIRSFTAFSEKHSPEEVVSVLNEYLGAMTEVIFRWEGTLDKFIGDAIVVFWGAPLRQDDHAELAVRCALDMVARVEELKRKWKSEGKAPFEIGVGINTGDALVGNIGAEGKKMDYTVIGDTVNLGSRIESLTKRYGSRILVSESTMGKIRPLVEAGAIGHLSIKGLDRVIVKGKEKAVAIYDIVGLGPGAASVVEENEDKRIVALDEK